MKYQPNITSLTNLDLHDTYYTLKKSMPFANIKSVQTCSRLSFTLAGISTQIWPTGPKYYDNFYESESI